MRAGLALLITALLLSSGARAQTISSGFWRSKPGAAATLDWDFLSLTSLPANLSFVRSGTATYFNSAGLLVSAPANTARFDYDPDTLAKKGLLIEPSVTNSIPTSQMLSPAGSGYAFYQVAAVVTDNVATAPDGTTTASRFAEGAGAGTNQHLMGTGGFPAGTPDNTLYTFSYFAKPGTLLGTHVFMQNKTGGYAGAQFEMTGAGIVRQQDASFLKSVSIKRISNGWYRIALTIDTGTGGSSPNIGVRLYDTVSNSSYYDAGAGGRYVYLWGFQLEQGEGATSYIPTAGSVVTRGAETLYPNLSPGWYDPSVGTLFAQYINIRPENPSSARVFGFFGSTGASDFWQNSVNLSDTGTSSLSNVINGTTTVFSPGGSINGPGIANKLAIAYAAGNFGFSANGANAVTGNSGAPPLSAAVYIGSQPDSATRARWIQKIRYYRERLSDPALKTLTQ
jgi:hypothetical protein